MLVQVMTQLVCFESLELVKVRKIRFSIEKLGFKTIDNTLGSCYRARPDNEYGPITNTGLFIGPFLPNSEYGGLVIGLPDYSSVYLKKFEVVRMSMLT